MASKPEAVDAVVKTIDHWIKYIDCAMSHPVLPSEMHARLGDTSEIVVPAVREMYPVVYSLYTTVSDAQAFREPVNALEVNAFDYYAIITSPMSLREILDNMLANKYSQREQVLRDLDLIWANTLRFNGENSPYTVQARKCEDYVKRKVQELADARLCESTMRDEFVQAVEQIGDEELFEQISTCVATHAPNMLLGGEELDIEQLTVGMFNRLMKIVRNHQRPSSRTAARSPAPRGSKSKSKR